MNIWTGACPSATDLTSLRSTRTMSCPRKHPNGEARPGCRSDGRRHEEQGFVLRNQRYANRGEPVQAQPCGRALPGLDRTSALRILFHTCKTKPNQKPDISLAIQSGHLDVLRTAKNSTGVSSKM